MYTFAKTSFFQMKQKQLFRTPEIFFAFVFFNIFLYNFDLIFIIFFKILI